MFLSNFYDFKNKAIETKAIIHSIKDLTNSTVDKDRYRLYAEYQINGKKYKEFLEAFSTSGLQIGPFSLMDTKNGDIITIYCNPNDPTDIKSDSSAIGGYVMLIIGIAFIFSYLLYKFWQNNKII